MDAQAIDQAVRLLNEARATGRLLAALPAACQPATASEGHAVQDATVTALGDAVAGWKVAVGIGGAVMRGVLLRSRCLLSPARLASTMVPLLGVEAEIAFAFERALPPRERDYSDEEVAAAVIALPAIEVVDTRFTSYSNTPVLHRLADCMSNGAFVAGSPRADWRRFDLAQLHVRLSIDGQVIADRIGGHASGNPLLPAVALANLLRRQGGIAAGQVVTTGTYTGLQYAKPGQTVVAEFEDFGAAQVKFDG